MSNKDLSKLFADLTEIFNKLQEEFTDIKTNLTTLTDSLTTHEADIKSLKKFRTGNQHQFSDMSKEMKDCQQIINEYRSTGHPSMSQVLQSLSTESMTSRAATSQTIEVFTRLTETTINKILAIPDASFVLILGYPFSDIAKIGEHFYSQNFFVNLLR